VADLRGAIMDAALEADRLHKRFDTKARANDGNGRIDVFGMLVENDIPVMFRPLKGLLGAYLNEDGAVGVMVTTQRQLPIQRFTAAHELGHAMLGHELSVDSEEILARSPFVDSESYDIREIQANAFASQLLTPSWLFAKQMVRQGWTRDNLTDPTIVYQLSLRLGTSYSATCHALVHHKAITKTVGNQLRQVEPKAIKMRLAGSHEPENWRGDVWLVTEKDNGMVLEGSRTDVVVLRFAEHSSSGYLWQFSELADAGLVVVQDGRVRDQDDDHFGGIVFRTVIAEPHDGAIGHVHLRETRPWQPDGDPLHSLDLDVDLSGPVGSGLLPAQRKRELLEVA
jgi:Zn-dependent peptidase ImmA (M78 family)